MKNIIDIVHVTNNKYMIYGIYNIQYCYEMLVNLLYYL